MKTDLWLSGFVCSNSLNVKIKHVLTSVENPCIYMLDLDLKRF